MRVRLHAHSRRTTLQARLVVIHKACMHACHACVWTPLHRPKLAPPLAPNTHAPTGRPHARTRAHAKRRTCTHKRTAKTSARMQLYTHASVRPSPCSTGRPSTATQHGPPQHSSCVHACCPAASTHPACTALGPAFDEPLSRSARLSCPMPTTAAAATQLASEPPVAARCAQARAPGRMHCTPG